MTMRITLLLWALSLLVLPGRALGQSAVAAPAKEAAAATPANTQLVVPGDTTIPLSLKNTISSRTAYVGQAIYCETIYPIAVGNRIVIPAGSYVKGAVTQVIRPGRVKGKAQLGLRFESITLVNGTTRPMRATLSAFTGNGNQGFRREESKVEGESSKKEDASTIARTAVTGAELGTLAGISTRHTGMGLGIGSAAGAAAGVIWVLATRGKDILLPPGTSLELQLSAPLSFERDELDPPIRYPEGPAMPKRDPGPGI